MANVNIINILTPILYDLPLIIAVLTTDLSTFSNDILPVLSKIVLHPML